MSVVKTLAWASSVICIAAGVYLLQWASKAELAAGEASWFDIVRVGLGVYFIGKGVYVGPALWKQAQAERHLDQLARLAEGEQHRRDRERRGSARRAR